MTALSISIGADTAQLTAQLALAQASFRGFNKDVREMSNEMQNASAEAQAEMLPQLEALTASAASAQARITALKTEIAALSPAAEHTGGAFISMRESVEGLNARISETKALASGMGELFLVGFGGEKIVELAKEAVELGDSLHKASEETGISVENLSALKGSADYADMSFDTLQRGLAKFATSMQAGIAGTGEQAQAFRILNITQEDFTAHGNDSAYMLEKVAKALDQYGDGANKQAIVSALFGVKLRDMGVILKDLAENGMQGLTDRAREQGVLFNGEYAESAKKAHDQMVQFDHMVQSLKADAIALTPAIEAVGHTLELVFGGDAERATVHLGAMNRGIAETNAEIARIKQRLADGSPGSLQIFDEADL